jgi:hypothetical protein
MFWLRVGFLFLAVLFTLVNAALVAGFVAGREKVIPGANFWYQAVGVTGFVTLQWLW